MNETNIKNLKDITQAITEDDSHQQRMEHLTKAFDLFAENCRTPGKKLCRPQRSVQRDKHRTPRDCPGAKKKTDRIRCHYLLPGQHPQQHLSRDLIHQLKWGCHYL